MYSVIVHSSHWLVIHCTWTITPASQSHISAALRRQHLSHNVAIQSINQSLFVSANETQKYTRKLSYRKDDRAMRPVSCECPENFRVTEYAHNTAIFPEIFSSPLF